MRSVSKSTVQILLLLPLSLLLVACGGLSGESAKERLLTATDFKFEVKVDSSPSEFEITDVFQGDCSELETVIADYSKSKVVAGSEYEDRSEAQNGFSLNEYVIQFPTKEDASIFLANVEKVAKNSDCEWFYSNTSQGSNGSAFGIGSEDFGNVRDLQTAFEVNADESVVLDIDTSLVISGTFLTTSSSEEGGVAFAVSGDLVVIIHYEVQADELSSASSPVTRKDLEIVVSQAFKKMLG